MSHRRVLVSLLAVLVLTAGGCASGDGAGAEVSSPQPTAADVASAQRPLFVNMTTDDSHRANMALSFGQKQQKLGHPLTVFLNDKGVFVGSTANTEYAMHQEMISSIIAAGGTVIACPMCTEHYGVDKATYVEGIEIGSPEFTGSKLFQDGSVTLTW